MIDEKTMVVLVLLFILFMWYFLRQVGKRWQQWDKHNAKAKPVKIWMLIEFIDGWSMSHPVRSPYEAQQFLNRFTWAGVKHAMVVVNDLVEYEVDSTGLLVYTACKS